MRNLQTRASLRDGYVKIGYLITRHDLAWSSLVEMHGRACSLDWDE